MFLMDHRKFILIGTIILNILNFQFLFINYTLCNSVDNESLTSVTYKFYNSSNKLPHISTIEEDESFLYEKLKENLLIDIPISRKLKEKEKENSKENSLSLTDDLEENMPDFLPTDIFSLVIPARGIEMFFENVTKSNMLIRGGFISNGESDETPLRVVILDPKGKETYSERGYEGIFQFNSKEIGIYTFKIQNTKLLTDQTVTFAMSVGEGLASNIKHLSKIDEVIDNLDRHSKDIQVASMLLWAQEKAYLSASKKLYNKIYSFAIFGFLFLLIISVIQIYYIKGLVSVRRVI